MEERRTCHKKMDRTNNNNKPNSITNDRLNNNTQNNSNMKNTESINSPMPVVNPPQNVAPDEYELPF